MDVGGIDGVHETNERRFEDKSESRLLIRQGKSFRRILTRDLGLYGRRRLEDVLEEGIRGSEENIELFLWDGILIFLDEAIRVVRYVKSVVTDRKGRLAETRLLVKFLVLGDSEMLI